MQIAFEIIMRYLRQAEELNTLIGNAFRLAYAMQLKEDRVTGNAANATTTLNCRLSNATQNRDAIQLKSFGLKK